MSLLKNAPRPTKEWKKAIENELDLHSLGSDTIGNLHWKRHFPQIDTVSINSGSENGRAQSKSRKSSRAKTVGGPVTKFNEFGEKVQYFSELVSDSDSSSQLIKGNQNVSEFIEEVQQRPYTDVPRAVRKSPSSRRLSYLGNADRLAIDLLDFENPTSVLDTSMIKDPVVDMNALRLTDRNIEEEFKQNERDRYQSFRRLSKLCKPPKPILVKRAGEKAKKIVGRDFYHPKMDFVMADLALSPYNSSPLAGPRSDLIKLSKKVRDVKYHPDCKQLINNKESLDCIKYIKIDNINEAKRNNSAKSRPRTINRMESNMIHASDINLLTSNAILDPILSTTSKFKTNDTNINENITTNEKQNEENNGIQTQIDEELLKSFVDDMKLLIEEKETPKIAQQKYFLPTSHQLQEDDSGTKNSSELTGALLLQKQKSKRNFPKPMLRKFRDKFEEIAEFKWKYEYSLNNKKKKKKTLPLMSSTAPSSAAQGTNNYPNFGNTLPPLHFNQGGEEAESKESARSVHMFFRSATQEGLMAFTDLLDLSPRSESMESLFWFDEDFKNLDGLDSLEDDTSADKPVLTTATNDEDDINKFSNKELRECLCQILATSHQRVLDLDKRISRPVSAGYLGVSMNSKPPSELNDRRPRSAGIGYPHSRISKIDISPTKRPLPRHSLK